MIRNARRIICTSGVLLATLRCGVAQAAWPSDPNVNVPVSTAAYIGKHHPTIVSDGAGGAIVTWTDYRNYDIYAQRVNATGAPQWGTDGVALCVAVNVQIRPTIASDGSGGAIVTWEDERRTYPAVDIYAQRVNGAGVSQWT